MTAPTKPRTVSELLAHAIALGACDGPTDILAYLSALGHDDVLRTGDECDRVDLLVWYLGRVDPAGIAGFARRCADRAAVYAITITIAVAIAAEAAIAVAAAASYAAAAARASSAAAIAYAADASAEVRAQLDDLHAMWRAHFGASSEVSP